MTRILKTTLTLLVFIVAIPVMANAQEESRAGKVQLGAGFGLSLNPPDDQISYQDNTQFNLEVFLGQHWTLGMNVDLFFRETDVLEASLLTRYHFIFENAPRLDLYLGAGAGYMINLDRGDWNTYGIDLIFPAFGIKYEIIDEHLAIGPNFSGHLIFPDSSINNNDVVYDFRILFVNLTYRF